MHYSESVPNTNYIGFPDDLSADDVRAAASQLGITVSFGGGDTTFKIESDPDGNRLRLYKAIPKLVREKLGRIMTQYTFSEGSIQSDQLIAILDNLGILERYYGRSGRKNKKLIFFASKDEFAQISAAIAEIDKGAKSGLVQNG